MVFVDLIIPVPLPNLFTYFVPDELQGAEAIGKRVVVRFGRSKVYTAIVRKIHDSPPTEYQAKSIEFFLDDQPIVLEEQLELWEWMASYYMCTIGEVMNAALPSGFKLISETRVLLEEHISPENLDLSDEEYLIFEALQIQGVLSLDEISAILGVKSVQKLIKSLIDKGVVALEEEVKERYKPKTAVFVQFNSALFQQSSDLEKAFDLVGRSKNQEELLLKIIGAPGFQLTQFKMRRSVLTKQFDVTPAVVKGLIDKGIFESEEVEIGRLAKYQGVVQDFPELSEAQSNAFEQITSAFSEKSTVLLHGVTGSGKTEVYIRLIQQVIESGKQVLYLLPEIALTTQIIARLQKVFGDQVGIFHSKFNLGERVEVWTDMLKSAENRKYKIFLGARSALFLPFQDLGLVIVDEEHENTFKQYDPAPRYHGRDLSVVLAHKHGAKVLLGSATPSVESFYNAKSGKYGFVELKKRFGGVQMPEIFCSDIGEARKKKEMVSLFTPMLRMAMEEALAAGEQIILFQNRRGFAPMLECDTCGHVQKCKRCDVSLTYNKYANLLKCHYCGYTEKVEVQCKACGSIETDLKGFGTEKIEEEVLKHFPNAKVARMDLDTTRGKHAYQNLLSDFEDKEIDILVGTQMLTKGLDFDNVGLVGVLNADQMLNYPDFRAFERAFQLMSQVSGRAGRKKKRGKVIIQTYNPHHSTIRQVIDHDYLEMYNNEILNRRNFYYPPFHRLVGLTFKHKDKNVLDACAMAFTNNLKAQIGEQRVLGPEYPSIARINNYYHKKLLIKAEKQISIVSIKQQIQHWVNVFGKDSAFKSVRIIIDVDPQ